MPVLNRFAILLLLFLAGTTGAQQNDVTFLVIGKHSNVQQQPDGSHESVDFSFFSEIFLTADGDASKASLQFPTRAVHDFRDMREAQGGERDNIFLISGAERPQSYAELLEHYPDGDYRFNFETPSGSVENGILTFADRPLPDPALITVQQGGQMQCGMLAPGKNAVVRWSDFAEGRSDPNGILDDLIFIILTDADGNRIAHSGRPFENRPYLTYAAQNFVIDGAVLQANQAYTLSVEHALLDDTTRFDSVPAFTTRAVTTKLELRTGPPGQEICVPMNDIPNLSSQTTMFYYKDLGAADRFYGEALGLEKTLDWDWVKFYKTGPASTVGLVAEGDGAWHDVQDKNAVMLSLVTEGVDAWYDRTGQREKATLTYSKSWATAVLSAVFF